MWCCIFKYNLLHFNLDQHCTKAPTILTVEILLYAGPNTKSISIDFMWLTQKVSIDTIKALQLRNKHCKAVNLKCIASLLLAMAKHAYRPIQGLWKISPDMHCSENCLLKNAYAGYAQPSEIKPLASRSVNIIRT